MKATPTIQPQPPALPALAPRPLSRLARGIRDLMTAVGRHQERRRAYRQLAMMNDWQLKDIGLSRSEIHRAVDGLLDRDY